MKKILIIVFLFGGIYAQDLIQPVPATNVIWADYNVTDVSSSISDAELFLQDISNEALAKDEKKPMTWATFNVTDDSIRVSEAELFLQDISDKAIAKDKKRKEFKMDMLTIAVVYLIIDKLFIK